MSHHPLIELVIDNFTITDEYIYDNFYKYFYNDFVSNYPNEIIILNNYYFPNNSTIDLIKLYDKIEPIVINLIIERNNDIENKFDLKN
jgi:hypothetical protein